MSKKYKHTIIVQTYDENGNTIERSMLGDTPFRCVPGEEWMLKKVMQDNEKDLADYAEGKDNWHLLKDPKDPIRCNHCGGVLLRKEEENVEQEKDPWWSPQPCDPEQHQYGWRYNLYWDHIGDAYEEYEALMDDWLKKRDEIAHLRASGRRTQEEQQKNQREPNE